MQNKICAVAAKLLTWTAKKKIVRGFKSPFAGMGLPGVEVSRDRVLSLGELRAVFEAAGDPSLGPYGPVFRLLTLTGKRRNEIALARWNEVDLDDRTLLIPAARAKNNEEDLTPLSDAAFAIFQAQPREPGVDLVFHKNGKPLSNWHYAKTKLDSLLPLGSEHFQLHDLRRSYATTLAKLETPPHVVEAALGHIIGSEVARTYNRYTYAKEKRLAAEAFARHISGDESSNIVRLAG